MSTFSGSQFLYRTMKSHCPIWHCIIVTEVQEALLFQRGRVISRHFGWSCPFQNWELSWKRIHSFLWWQVLGGLATPTEGSIYLGKDGVDVSQNPSGPLSLSTRVGVVFQFPERWTLSLGTVNWTSFFLSTSWILFHLSLKLVHGFCFQQSSMSVTHKSLLLMMMSLAFYRYFLTDTIVDELLFGYSRQTQDFHSRHALTLRLQNAVLAVGPSSLHRKWMSTRALRTIAFCHYSSDWFLEVYRSLSPLWKCRLVFQACRRTWILELLATAISDVLLSRSSS